jgi:hypothetical protein
MTADIVVVEEAESKDKVEAMARRRYSDLPDVVLRAADFEVRTDGAEWCNHIAPMIRCLAGYRDNSRGTWTHNGDIALIADGDEMDTPADAVVMSAADYHKELMDVFMAEAYRQWQRQRNDYLAEHKEHTDA